MLRVVLIAFIVSISSNDTIDPECYMTVHGILADGFNWASNMPNQSAGFVFADAGFDIWIANSRGTPPSQKHTGYGPKDDRFWNFTWQDMSSYDLTDSINYVLKETGQKSLYYIGHSQGTVIMFAKLAEDPQFGKKTRVGVYLCHFPAATSSKNILHWTQWRIPSGESWDTSIPITVCNVAVVGGGTMGRGIAIALCRAGYRTVLVESDEKNHAF
uniref:AB hydrolase-1 domain-containing protein n=1 Tax=Heterorhabditis bacteriophora TaxID=37862 RepID=A0A1I7X0X2_HETBA